MKNQTRIGIRWAIGHAIAVLCLLLLALHPNQTTRVAAWLLLAGITLWNILSQPHMRNRHIIISALIYVPSAGSMILVSSLVYRFAAFGGLLFAAAIHQAVLTWLSKRTEARSPHDYIQAIRSRAGSNHE